MVAAALKDVLQLKEDLQDDEVSFSTAECQNAALVVNSCFPGNSVKFHVQATADYSKEEKSTNRKD